MTEITMREQIEYLCSRHGGLRAAGRAVQLDPGYLSKLMSGEKQSPSPKILRRLGLKRIVRYERS